MKNFKNTVLVPALIAFTMALPQLSFAQSEKSDGDKAAKIKMHEQMAVTHQKTAACLKSESSIEECHSKMMKDCPMAKEGKKCPMMDHQHMEGMDYSKMGKKKK